VLASLLVTACAAHDSKKAAPATAAGPPAAGYTKLINNAGEPVYCVKKAPTGSNISRTTTCMTAAEWERLRDDDRDLVNQMRKDNPRPDGF
jgi:hypothetical protein